MRSSSNIILAAAAISLATLAGANPTLTGGAAKRFEPSSGTTCYYTCPDLADGTEGVDTGVPPTPADGPSFPAGWAYVPGGLIADSSSRGLERIAYDGNPSMTNELCVSICLDFEYRLSATQDGRQCFCGNDLQNGASFFNKGGNTIACFGDASQNCGGSYVNRVSYNKADVAPGLAAYLATLTECTYSGATSAGCAYTSSTGALQPQEPATCPARATAGRLCGAGGGTVTKRQFARSLTPLERKIKSRQFSFKKAPAARRAPTTGGGPAWLKQR